MVISRYSFPLPNNGERYDLSQDELVVLLDAAYQNGWDQARNTYDVKITSNATSNEYKEVHLWKKKK